MVMRAVLIALSGSKGLKNFFTHHRFAQRTSSRFIAGLNVEEAVPVVKALNQGGITATMDHLGENVNNQEEAEAATAEALDIFNTLEEECLNGNVSIKLTQMGLDLGEDICRNNVLKLVQRAHELNNFLRIDMEGSDYTDRTLDIFYHFRKDYESVGIVIQSCLYRSVEDVKKILSMGGRIRLCKGAYKEPPDRAFPRKKGTNDNFILLTKMMLDSGIYHGIATHDEKMIDATIQYAEKQGIPKDGFEFQMLHGIRRDLQRQLVGDGYRMRIYVPYGTEWYPYFMRRLAERPANVLFLIKNFFK